MGRLDQKRKVKARTRRRRRRRVSADQNRGVELAGCGGDELGNDVNKDGQPVILSLHARFREKRRVISGAPTAIVVGHCRSTLALETALHGLLRHCSRAKTIEWPNKQDDGRHGGHHMSSATHGMAMITAHDAKVNKFNNLLRELFKRLNTRELHWLLYLREHNKLANQSRRGALP